MSSRNIARGTKSIDLLNLFKTLSCSAALMAAVGLAPVAAYAQSQPNDGGLAEAKRAYRQLEQAIFAPAISGELRKLPPMNRGNLASRFLQFKVHVHDASRINPNPAPETVPPGSIRLSKAVQAIIQQALSPIYGESQGAKGVLLSQISQEQALSALEAMENDKNLFAAAKLAQALAEKEPQGHDHDLLALVAARDAWLSYAGKAPQYQILITQATQSADAEVATQARLWQEAVTNPQSAEALLLAHQIWKSAYLDMGQRANGYTLSWQICKNGPAVYEQVKASQRDQAEKEHLLGQLAVVISEAAFQSSNQKLVDWAATAAAPLSQAAAEDKLYTEYNQAWRLYAEEKNAQACKAFEKIFFTGTVCDTSAESGYVLAEILDRQGDTIGAIATLEMLNKLYSTQRYVMPKANQMLEQLRRKAEGLDPRQISQYVEKHYKTSYEKALAQKQKTAPAPELASINIH